MDEWQASALKLAYERALPATAPRAQFVVVQLCDTRQRPTDRYNVEYWEADPHGWELGDGQRYTHTALPPWCTAIAIGRPTRH